MVGSPVEPPLNGGVSGCFRGQRAGGDRPAMGRKSSWGTLHIALLVDTLAGRIVLSWLFLRKRAARWHRPCNGLYRKRYRSRVIRLLTNMFGTDSTVPEAKNLPQGRLRGGLLSFDISCHRGRADLLAANASIQCHVSRPSRCRLPERGASRYGSGSVSVVTKRGRQVSFLAWQPHKPG